MPWVRTFCACRPKSSAAHAAVFHAEKPRRFSPIRQRSNQGSPHRRSRLHVQCWTPWESRTPRGGVTGIAARPVEQWHGGPRLSLEAPCLASFAHRTGFPIGRKAYTRPPPRRVFGTRATPHVRSRVLAGDTA